jgi:hypothetical protein
MLKEGPKKLKNDWQNLTKLLRGGGCLIPHLIAKLKGGTKVR